MPRFVTIGYGDRAGYDRTSPDIRNAAHAHDAELKRRGALIGVAGFNRGAAAFGPPTAGVVAIGIPVALPPSSETTGPVPSSALSRAS